MYHYKTCGLNNVYLVNGYELIKTSEGEAVSIHDLDGLHRSIAKTLVFLRRPLKGNEFRFLRTELDMSQKTLGFFMDKEDQTIANWEKGNSAIPKLADMAIRFLYLGSIEPESKLRSIFDALNELDRTKQERRKQQLKFTKDSDWHTAA